MKRIIVIDSPGAGKSTFARQLRDITGLPFDVISEADVNGWTKLVAEKSIITYRWKHPKANQI